MPVDVLSRIQPLQELEYKKVSYKQYISDTTATYLNMRTDKYGNQMPALIAKLHNENDIVCKVKPSKLAYFDIETYDTDLTFDGIPMANRQTSHISMMSLVVDNTAILFHLDIYQFNVESAKQTLFAHCGQLFNIETQTSGNENDMVLQFLMYLRTLSDDNTIILSGFNSS